MTGRQGGRPSSPRPRARWRPVAFCVAAVTMPATAVAFAFCVIASASGWHPAVTRPGIAVSVVLLVACAVVLNLTGDGE